MQSFTAEVTRNESLGKGTYVLHFKGCEPLAGCLPGQFVMLRGDWGRDPLLPRAFSIMSVGEGGTAEVLGKSVGRATSLMERALVGARFHMLGPLGTSFAPAEGEREHWLVAGGVGLAPLLFHAERAAAAGHAARVRMFYGGRSAADLVLLQRLRRLGIGLELATEDGSLGATGYVTAPLLQALAAARTPPVLMACGPDPMLVAVARIGRERALKTYLSLEGEMACGIGVCLGCAVPCATRPYRYTCVEGPVMDLDELRGPYA